MDTQPILKKAVILSMLPEKLSLKERFVLAKEAGYQGVEVQPLYDAKEISETRAAADAAGIELHSVIFGGWQKPLSSADPALADEGAKQVEAGLRSAKELGAGALLLVPAFVNAETRYLDAYTRSQAQLRKIIPTAEKLGVTICVENVWNNFLLSPIEFARYIDELDSPFLQAYFDVGNVVAFGWPEDWIRTLGPRIKRIHLKDFKRDGRQWANLRDGDVNWPEVRKALAEVRYSGYLTAELAAGDKAYLKELSGRIDKIIAGA